MENYEDIYKKICRVCLTIIRSEKMESLIDDTVDQTGLSCFGKAIPTFARVSYKKDDKLPPNVCQKCIYLLKQAIYFKFTCESSEKWLKSVLENNLKYNLSDSKIQENICQYVMYRHYFPRKSVSNFKKRSNYCSFPQKSILKSTDSSKVGMSLVNNQLNNKKCDLKNDNLLEEYDSNLSDFEDNFSNNLSQKSVKSTSKALPVVRKLKKPKEDKIQLITAMKTLITKKEIKKKVKRHRIVKQRDIPCEICNKILANPLTYDQHMQRHSICKYVCDKCGKGFPVLAELHIHQISRHGIGPYLQCDHCSYKAPTKLKLKEHIRLHTGERPFTCDKCGLTFRRQAIWRNHQVLHLEKQFQCKICPQKFYRQHQMLAHMNNVHERKYVYICNICEITYAKTETVRRHMISKHDIKRELQGKIRRVDKSPHCFPDK